MIRTGTFRRQQQKNEIDRLFVDRIEIDRRFKPAEQAEHLLGLGQLAMWNGDAVANTRGAEARTQGAAAYCGRVPWKLVLVPGAATEDAKAAFLRERPQVPREALDEFIWWMGWVLALADNTSWIDSPCTDFWPATLK